mgnify:CR=1 FL=1
MTGLIGDSCSRTLREIEICLKKLSSSFSFKSLRRKLTLNITLGHALSLTLELIRKKIQDKLSLSQQVQPDTKTSMALTLEPLERLMTTAMLSRKLQEEPRTALLTLKWELKLSLQKS